MKVSLRPPEICPNCYELDIHPSRPRARLDWFLQWFLHPHRCHYCNARYWSVFRARTRVPSRPLPPSAAVQRPAAARAGNGQPADEALLRALGIGEHQLLASPYVETLEPLRVVGEEVPPDGNPATA